MIINKENTHIHVINTEKKQVEGNIEFIPDHNQILILNDKEFLVNNILVKVNDKNQTNVFVVVQSTKTGYDSLLRKLGF